MLPSPQPLWWAGRGPCKPMSQVGKLRPQRAGSSTESAQTGIANYHLELGTTSPWCPLSCFAGTLAHSALAHSAQTPAGLLGTCPSLTELPGHQGKPARPPKPAKHAHLGYFEIQPLKSPHAATPFSYLTTDIAFQTAVTCPPHLLSRLT